MNKLLCLSGGLALMVLASLIGAPAGARDDEVPSVKDVMGQLHKGANSPIREVGKALQDDSPDWDKIKPQAKLFEVLGAALPRNEPSVGSKESWEKYAKAYYEKAKDLSEATEEEDKEAALEAHGALAKSCAACHKSHRE
ncbi:hypothetical protein BH23PLA1_BH23PLA1_27870 [soil metagenome]